MDPRRVIEAIERIAPPHLAESWDNVGLIAGSLADDRAGPVLLTIDLTEPVAEEAAHVNAALVVAYHPPIFRPTRRLTDDTPEGRAVLTTLAAGAAIYSPHTALDATNDGIADWLLSAAAGDREAQDTRRAIAPHQPRDPRQTHKVVVFVPRDDTDRVVNAMAAAGAGIIGDYSHCSYRIDGTGAFLPGDETDPTIGERGVLEHVHETRVEMVCGQHHLPNAIAALVRAHPYEEPAFDVYALADRPDPSRGAGRLCAIDQPTPAADIAHRLRDNLHVTRIRLAADDNATIERVAVCPGAGAGLLNDSGLLNDTHAASRLLFVTGEMSHHDVLAARAAGASVALAGHTNTERGYLPHLQRRLETELAPHPPDIRISQRDAWPFREH